MTTLRLRSSRARASAAVYGAWLFASMAAVPVPAQTLRLEDADFGRIPEGFSLRGPLAQAMFDEALADLGRVQYEQTCRPDFSPDGSSVACVLWRDAEPHPYENGVVGDACEQVLPFFAARGGRAFFWLRKALPAGGHRDQIRRGVSVLAEADEIFSFGVSPDGGKLAYFATSPEPPRAGKEPELIFYQTGRKPVAVQGVGVTPVFSPRGNRWITTSSDGKRWRTMVAGSSGLQHGKRECDIIVDLTVDPAGRRIGTSSKVDAPAARRYVLENTVVVVDDKVYGDKFDSAGAPVFSRDGRHVAYRVLRDDKLGLCCDAKACLAPSFGWLAGQTFDPSGARIACTASEQATSRPMTLVNANQASVAPGGTSFLLVVEREGGEVRGPEFLSARDPAFSPDGKNIAYAARDAEGWWLVIADGPRAGPFDDVAVPRWAEDSKRVGFGVRAGDLLGWRVLALGP